MVVGGAAHPHASVLTAVRTARPPYAVPGRLMTVEALPLTANGKIDRAAVARLLAGF
ncbi:hypothetical protein [Streptomyces sp. MA5143a]|uniref:hypothetical protein n=1 Tax=Streptomyces sp. MA5143a TaxID=2083010 RepID=UPI000D2EFC39|nr:hypothetical protein [Streptomyces sp. MA5143a]SPE99824.1 enterobactin synthase subunit F [Streptomyces sp. MA5143a]